MNHHTFSFSFPFSFSVRPLNYFLQGLLDQLDEQVAEAGGRLYLAKHSRQSANMLERSYPLLDSWRQQRALLDPRSVFSSDLARRVKL